LRQILLFPYTPPSHTQNTHIRTRKKPRRMWSPENAFPAEWVLHSTHTHTRKRPGTHAHKQTLVTKAYFEIAPCLSLQVHDIHFFHTENAFFYIQNTPSIEPLVASQPGRATGGLQKNGLRETGLESVRGWDRVRSIA
jgi:hypothetical protein